MKNKLCIWILVVLLLSLGFSWEIQVNGLREETLTQGYFEQMKTHFSHYQEIGFYEKGDFVRYEAMPLWMIIAMADGVDSVHPYKFDRQNWENGYEVTLTGENGYSVTFDTAQMPFGQLWLADRQEGKEISPAIVGNVAGKYWVNNLVSIDLALVKPVEEAAYDLEFKIDEKVFTYSITQLAESEFYVEKPGRYTTSAGSTYEGVYAGIKIFDFLKSLTTVTVEDTLKLYALDGYDMTYSMGQIADSTDGDWILAFKMDGELIPMDPGPVRTIKVGDSNPNIEGHLSGKMIKRIELIRVPFQSYTLEMKGLMNFTIDRQTFDSGVNCHKLTVQYKSKTGINSYTGIALWRMLAYIDDPQFAPHKQDSATISYNAQLAKKGYKIKITAMDGYSIVLRSEEIDGNDSVILASMKNDASLPDEEWPLILVWQNDSQRIPSGIKSVKQVKSIEAIFE